MTAESKSPDETPAETSEPPEHTDDDAAESVAIAADGDPDAPSRLRRLVLPIGAAVVVIALAVTTGFAANAYLNDRDREQLNAHYIDAARQGVLNVISVSAGTADRDVDRILNSATGDFRADFASRSKDFVSVVEQMKVRSKGTVNLVGIESSDEHRAAVLVSATSLVTNGSGAQDEPRVWRLRVHLTNDDDRILIEKVDFAV